MKKSHKQEATTPSISSPPTLRQAGGGEIDAWLRFSADRVCALPTSRWLLRTCASKSNVTVKYLYVSESFCTYAAEGSRKIPLNYTSRHTAHTISGKIPVQAHASVPVICMNHCPQLALLTRFFRCRDPTPALISGSLAPTRSVLSRSLPPPAPPMISELPTPPLPAPKSARSARDVGAAFLEASLCLLFTYTSVRIGRELPYHIFSRVEEHRHRKSIAV